MPLRRLKLNGMQGNVRQNVMQMVGAGGMPPTRPVAGGGMPPMPTFQPAQKLPLPVAGGGLPQSPIFQPTPMPVAGGGLPPAYKPTPKPITPSFAGARAPMQGRMANGLLNMPQGVVPQTFAPPKQIGGAMSNVLRRIQPAQQSAGGFRGLGLAPIQQNPMGARGMNPALASIFNRWKR